MLETVLIAVDGSPTSYVAARQGLSLANQARAKAILLFVMETPSVLPMGPLSGYVVTSPPRTDADLAKAKTELQELGREFPQLVTEARVEMGDPTEVICETAASLGVSLIVVGARGHSAGMKWLLGSVSDRIVHHAPCAVMVVRERK